LTADTNLLFKRLISLQIPRYIVINLLCCALLSLEHVNRSFKMGGVVLNEICILNNLWAFMGKIDRHEVRFLLLIKNPCTKFTRNPLSDFRDKTYAHDPPIVVSLSLFYANYA
jgi:hypothetical protein